MTDAKESQRPDDDLLNNSASADSEERIASADTKQAYRELHWLEKLNIFGQMGLVIVGIIAAAIYGRQLGVMKSQLAQMQGSSQQTDRLLGLYQQQTDAMKQLLAGTFGAIVPAEFPRPSPIADDPELLKYKGINLFFANVGKIKATNFIANATLTRKSLPSYGTIGESQSRQVRASQIRPYDQMPPGVPGVYADDAHMTFDTRAFTKQDIDLLHEMKETIE